MQDPWTREGIHHRPIWAFYTIGNATGAILCTWYAWNILRKRRNRKTARDVAVLTLLAGCIGMSAVCSSQCFINILSGTERFQDWLDAGCLYEALGHIVFIQLQYMGIAAVAYYAYRTVRQTAEKLGNHESVVPVPTALVVLALMLLYSAFGTILTLQWSDVHYLYTYCFPDFASPMFIWVASSMVLSLIFTAVCYWHVFAIARAIDTELAIQQTHLPEARTKEIRAAAKQSIILVIGFLVGWGTAVIACFWSWTSTGGSIPAETEVTMGIFGTLFSVFVPVAYGRVDREMRRGLRRCGCCCSRQRCDRWCPEFEQRVSPVNNAEKTIATRRYRSDREEKRRQERLLRSPDLSPIQSREVSTLEMPVAAWTSPSTSPNVFSRNAPAS